MTPYENIKTIVANTKPSMAWDKVEPIADWQKRAREKLAELVGLDKMVKAENPLRWNLTVKMPIFVNCASNTKPNPGISYPAICAFRKARNCRSRRSSVCRVTARVCT